MGISDFILERLNEMQRGIMKSVEDRCGRWIWMVACALCHAKCGPIRFLVSRFVCRAAYRDWWLIIDHCASPADADHIFTLNMVPPLNTLMGTIKKPRDLDHRVEPITNSLYVVSGFLNIWFKCKIIVYV